MPGPADVRRRDEKGETDEAPSRPPAQQEGGQAAKVVEKIKDRVVKEKIPVNRIYREEMRAVADDKEALQLIPTFAHMKSAFYKSRGQAFGAVPASLELLKSPSSCNVLRTGKGFSSTKSRETRF